MNRTDGNMVNRRIQQQPMVMDGKDILVYSAWSLNVTVNAKQNRNVKANFLV